MLSDLQVERYSRHIMLKVVGGKGQERLLNGKILIVGVGGLGSPIALYLAAAGVGTIGIADADEVELSNLQRQIIHHTMDIGRGKVISAKEKMEAMNPDIKVNTYQKRINSGNIKAIIEEYDFIIDATDNFASKFLINDACVLSGIPFSHGGVLQFDGQTITVKPGNSPCYRCIFPTPPPDNLIPTCSQAGVMGVIPAVIGSIQATEAIKYLLGTGELLTGRLLIYDALHMKFREVRIRKNPGCPVCGETPTITALAGGPVPSKECAI
jgi:molybdopterin/thiamine biosynthesis adenylyltransferase